MTKSLAAHFAERAASRGFRAVVTPGTEDLARASDVFLSRLDERVAKFACIVDLDTGEHGAFRMSLGDVLACARAASGQRAAFVEIFEAGECTDPAQRRRLQPLSARLPKSGVDIAAWAFHPRSGKLWTNAPLWGLFRGRQFFREVVDSFRDLSAP